MPVNESFFHQTLLYLHWIVGRPLHLAALATPEILAEIGPATPNLPIRETEWLFTEFRKRVQSMAWAGEDLDEGPQLPLSSDERHGFEAIQKLPKPWREAIYFVEVQRFSPAEAARILDATEAEVLDSLHLGLVELSLAGNGNWAAA